MLSHGAMVAREELEKIRPDLDGNQIMEVLGVSPGPVVGKAYRYLLELRMEQGPLGAERAVQELRRWAEAEGLQVPGGPGERARPSGPGGPGGGPPASRDPGSGPASSS